VAVFCVNRFPAQSPASASHSPTAQTASLPSQEACTALACSSPSEGGAVALARAARSAPAASPAALAFAAAIDTLTSPRATYAERQAAWNQIQNAGQLKDAVNELTRRMNADTNDALDPAALGQAYLKLCGTTNDVRSKALWAMNADACFETALNLDPSNWEARFTKAMAMTYWPASLGKGPEVIDQFNTLIQQQEQEPPQPQFAKSYDWLGVEYEKTGQPDLALQTWERGAALFPDDESLRNHLASASAAPR
jgi:tetratricopeptide (TPR) repeat protein